MIAAPYDTPCKRGVHQLLNHSKGTVMRSVLKWMGIVVGVIVVVVALGLGLMRFHDGPLELLSGGPFRSGVETPTPKDWGFLKDRVTIEFQTMVPDTSRTVWLAVHEGRLFLISGYMTTGYGKLWKQWPHYIEEDNRVILRIDGKLYQQHLDRIMTGDEVQPVLDELGRKYGFTATSDVVRDGHAWMYEVK